MRMLLENLAEDLSGFFGPIGLQMVDARLVGQPGRHPRLPVEIDGGAALDEHRFDPLLQPARLTPITVTERRVTASPQFLQPPAGEVPEYAVADLAGDVHFTADLVVLGQLVEDRDAAGIEHRGSAVDLERLGRATLMA